MFPRVFFASKEKHRLQKLNKHVKFPSIRTAFPFTKSFLGLKTFAPTMLQFGFKLHINFNNNKQISMEKN